MATSSQLLCVSAPHILPSTDIDNAVFKSERSVVTIHLGSRAQLKQLFSYPNHPSHNCATDSDDDCQERRDEMQTDTAMLMSLEKTIQHYLETSMIRDGYVESKIETLSMEGRGSKDDSVYVKISGKAAVPYSRAIPEFLNIGQLGLQACQHIQANGLWRDHWRFFLPLGLPLTRHWTVELLHFPPIYTLEEDQDYLASRSTQRWRQLLQINRSSSGTKHTTADIIGDPETTTGDQRIVDPTDRFQAIIDIVPIAAPSSDGKNMKDVYPYFEEYVRASLQFWARRDYMDHAVSAREAKPLVAFGWPVKCWVETNQSQEGDESENVIPLPKSVSDKTGEAYRPTSLGVLSLARLNIGSEAPENDASSSAPVLIANHPSYLYNAGRRMQANGIESLGDDDRALLERIMTEDLIAARWQVRMGLDPSQDAQSVFQESCQYWRDAARIDQIHQLINKQAFILQEP